MMVVVETETSSDFPTLLQGKNIQGGSTGQGQDKAKPKVGITLQSQTFVSNPLEACRKVGILGVPLKLNKLSCSSSFWGWQV